MKSGSAGMVWAIWKRNQWGFLLLAALFACSLASSRHAVHLRQRAKAMEKGGLGLSGGSVTLGKAWGGHRTGKTVLPVELRFGDKVLHEGLLSATDQISWASTTDAQFTITLHGADRDHGQYAVNVPPNLLATPSRMTWSVKQATNGLVALTLRIVPRGFDEDRAVAMAAAEVWRVQSLAWSAVLLGFSVLAVFAIFACAEPHPARGFTGIPPRWFVLPVSTRTLVLWPMALGGGTLAIICLAWFGLVFRGILPEGMNVPILYLLSIWVSCLFLFQFLVWALSEFPRTRMLLLTLLLFGLLILSVLPFAFQRGVGPQVQDAWARWQPRLAIGFAVAGLAGIGMSWIGVDQRRHGGWSGERPVRLPLPILQGIRPRPLEFASPLGAQCWIEWRSNCRLPLLIWAGLVFLVTAFFVAKTSPLEAGDLRGVFTSVVVSGMAVWGAVTGLNLARDAASKKNTLSSFSATRPVSEGTLLGAKLLTGLATWFLGTGIALGAACVLFAFGGEAHRLSRLYHQTIVFELPVIIVFLPILLHLFVGILPVCASGRIRGIPWSLLPLILVYGGAIELFAWVIRNRRYEYLFLLLVGLVFIKAGVAFLGFYRSLALRLVSWGFVATYLACWVFGTGILLLLAIAAEFASHGDQRVLFLIPAALVVLPLARVSLSPLALSMNRHR